MIAVDTYANPPLALLEQLGADIACRYISHTSAKVLTAAEVALLHGAGRGIVCNFEDGATNARGGASQGRLDGTFAVATVQRLGLTPAIASAAGRPMVVYSIDWEATDWEIARDVVPYFTAVRYQHAGSNLRVGAYGCARVLRALFAAGVIDLGWLTSAWSYGDRMTDEPRVAFYQHVYAGTYDVSDVRGTDTGTWWPPGSAHTPTSIDTHQEDDMTPIQAQQLAYVYAQLRRAVAPGQRDFAGTIAATLGAVQHDTNVDNATASGLAAIRAAAAKLGVSA